MDRKTAAMIGVAGTVRNDGWRTALYGTATQRVEVMSDGEFTDAAEGSTQARCVTPKGGNGAVVAWSGRRRSWSRCGARCALRPRPTSRRPNRELTRGIRPLRTPEQ